MVREHNQSKNGEVYLCFGPLRLFYPIKTEFPTKTEFAINRSI